MIFVLSKILLLTLFFFIVACSGMKLLRLLGINKGTNLELFVLAAGAGFALISEGLLVLGMIGLFSPLSLCILVVGLFVMSAKEAKYFLTTFFSYLRTRDFFFTEQFFLSVTFLVFVIINIFKALLPPHGPTDVLFYHMTVPKLFLIHGAIVTNPTFFPSFFPSNGELLFSLALVLGGPVMVNLTNFGFALLTVMALYVYAQKYFEKKFALIPGIIFLTAPVINSWGTMAYTCNILGFYLFLLCMLLIDCNDETKVSNVVLVGLITGMALGIKYQAIPLVGCIYFFFFVYKIRHWKRRALVFTGALLLAIILASPWFVRNFLITKNPFFPILNDIFPSEMMSAESTWGEKTSAGGAFVLGLNKLNEKYFFPFSYLWTGAWGHDEDFQRFIGPLFLFFTPFIFFLKKNPLKWPLISLICLLSYLSTFLLGGNIRYVVILLILLSLLCGAVGQWILSFGKRVRYMCLAFFIFFIIFYSFQNYNLMLSHKRILTALNPNLNHYFLKITERSYYPAVWANRNLPDDAKVLFHGFVRYFYFKFEPFNDHRSQTVINYDEAKNGDDILKILLQHGFTHIISLDVIPESYRKDTIVYDEDPRFIDFTRKYLEKIFSANGISIYRIKVI